jgi:hypothetical protein
MDCDNLETQPCRFNGLALYRCYAVTAVIGARIDHPSKLIAGRRIFRGPRALADLMKAARRTTAQPTEMREDGGSAPARRTNLLPIAVANPHYRK